MSWLPTISLSEPIFLTLVRAFYSKVRFFVGGPISCTLRGAEIELDADVICRVLGVLAVELRVYEFKTCLIVLDFIVWEVVQRHCGLPNTNRLGKSSTNNLTTISRVLHHLICYLLMPKGGHQDEVSYLETFLIDLILIGWWIHPSYIMIQHMIVCYQTKTWVFPCDRFLTKVLNEYSLPY